MIGCQKIIQYLEALVDDDQFGQAQQLEASLINDIDRIQDIQGYVQQGVLQKMTLFEIVISMTRLQRVDMYLVRHIYESGHYELLGEYYEAIINGRLDNEMISSSIGEMQDDSVIAIEQQVYVNDRIPLGALINITDAILFFSFSMQKREKLFSQIMNDPRSKQSTYHQKIIDLFTRYHDYNRAIEYTFLALQPQPLMPQSRCNYLLNSSELMERG